MRRSKQVLVVPLRGPRTGLMRELHVSAESRARYGFDASLFSIRGNAVIADYAAAQDLAAALNRVRQAHRNPHLAVRAGDLFAAAVLHEVMHLVLELHRERGGDRTFAAALEQLSDRLGEERLEEVLAGFVRRFPAGAVARGELSQADYLAGATGGIPHREIVLEELLLVWLANRNPALDRFRELFDDRPLERETDYGALTRTLGDLLTEGPGLPGVGDDLLELLLAPQTTHPTSLQGQLAFVRERWSGLLGERFGPLLRGLLRSLDVLREEQKGGFGGPGPSIVLDRAALRGPAGPIEYERFSPDSSWMPRVVLVAKSTYVWLDQLSRLYGRDIVRLDQIPDRELDELAARGFNTLWLIGVWQRSEASRRIKHLRGQPDAVASAYSLEDYLISEDLGGEAAFVDLRDRAWQRGIRLASDMVPNHMGVDSRWVRRHPDWFLQIDQSPYPGYSFDGPDLSPDPAIGIFLEDHYYDSSDAAVVFKRLDRRSGEVRYIYHGNDGTSMPWNDTAQLDYLNPETREGVIQTILHVARLFPVIRFDAAMTLAKQHIQRLWFPVPGEGGAIPSRSQYGSMAPDAFEAALPREFWREVVDRVAAEVPDTLLLAEAFWMMEGYFVRTLGMHRVYNSAFMNMLKREENRDYRQLVKNVLEFDPQILKRFVNFMNNPDEETAVAQFGKDDRYFGVCVLLATMPGLPMFGHGQVEGFTEKYGMEFRRAKLQEEPDGRLVARHEREIFPLLHRRQQFAEVEEFLFFDLVGPDGSVDEDVFAYSNRHRDQASLVAFNNRFAQARGWIRQSVPFALKGGEGTARRSLVEGLGLEGGAGRYALLGEHVSGLEYLVPSDDLRERGLFLDLEAFGYRVYLDIREVQDSTGRPYARLARQLAGTGVPSIEVALKELLLSPALEAWERLLVAAAAGTGVREAWEAYLAAAQPHGLEPTAAQRRGILADLEVIEAEPPEGALSLGAAATWALLRHLDAPESRIGGLGLDRGVLRYLERSEAAIGVGEEASLRRPGAAAELLALVVRFASGIGARPQGHHWLRTWFGDDDARRFLRVHSATGAEWFERERYRALVAALVAAAAVGRPEAGAQLEDVAAFLARAEEESGYRVDRLPFSTSPGTTRPVEDRADGHPGGDEGDEAEVDEAEAEEEDEDADD